MTPKVHSSCASHQMVSEWSGREPWAPASAGWGLALGVGKRTEPACLFFGGLCPCSDCQNVCMWTGVTSKFSGGFPGPPLWRPDDVGMLMLERTAGFLAWVPSQSPWPPAPPWRASLPPKQPRQGRAGHLEGHVSSDSSSCFSESDSWDRSHHKSCGGWRNKLKIINQNLN